MEINLSEYGTTIGPRALGARIKDEIINDIEEDEDLVFLLDDLSNLSTGFAKELFGELYLYFGDQFKNRVSFHFNEEQDKSIFLQSINRGIKAAIEKD